MIKKHKNLLNSIPEEYLTAMTLILPELVFGCDTTFISNKIEGWTEINKRLSVYASANATDTGVIYQPVADGAILTMNYAVLRDRLPLVEQATRITGLSEELSNFAVLHKQMRETEYAKLNGDLLSNITTETRDSRLIFGIYGKGGPNRYADIGGEHYPIYKLTVNDVIRALTDVYKRCHCRIVLSGLAGTIDLTDLLKQSMTGTPNARANALTALKKRLYSNGIQAFEGNALMYTLTFN